jgi:outer membrane autotransporter protein
MEAGRPQRKSGRVKPRTVQATALVLPPSTMRQWWFVAALFVTLALLVASASPAAALQKWTLAKTASPSTYGTAGQVITYTYVVTSLDDRTGSLKSLVDNKIASISCPTTIMPSLGSITCTGTYTITAADLANGSVTNTATVTGDSCTDGCAVTAQASATITAVPRPVDHRADTQQTIGGFLGHRNALLATHEPDRSRLVRRLPGSLWGDANSGQAAGASDPAVAISGSDDDHGSRLAFATSLSRLGARSNGSLKDGGSEPARAASPATNGVDIWVEGHFSDYRDRAGGLRSTGRFGVLYVGADYLLTPAILVGALAQFDWTGEAPGHANTSVDGQGYMAGPYASIRLTQHLYLDARTAWGSSDNSVNPLGTYEDKFSTDRWLAHAKLTGNWHFGNFRLTPSLAYTYLQDKQRSYTDAPGEFIPSQTVSLGRLSFGPEIAYRLMCVDGTIWEPQASIQGVWDDTDARSSLIGGLLADGNDFRGLVQAGVLVSSPRGPSVRAVASYDGLGSGTGFHDLGGQVWLNIPLH